jgi:hypothetical protein
MRPIIFAALLFCLNNIAASAQTYTGKVSDAQNAQAIAYVNIGVEGMDIGTVSDNEGNFTLTLPDTLQSGRMRFSIVGYEAKTFELADFKKQAPPIIRLQPLVFDLPSVAVQSYKLKSKLLGCQAESPRIGGGFASNNLGSEVGLLIRTKRNPTYLDDFNFCISKNQYDTLFFRLNVYEYKNGLPERNILQQAIYITVTETKKGWVSVDLAPYNIVVQGDFVIALEWVADFTKGGNIQQGLVFPIGLGHQLFARKTSQGNWRKHPFGIGFNVTAKY